MPLARSQVTSYLHHNPANTRPVSDFPHANPFSWLQTWIHRERFLLSVSPTLYFSRFFNLHDKSTQTLL